MELPKRPLGDEFARPGDYRRISERLAANPQMRELTALIIYAFDVRTRLLPYVFVDWRMIPAGVRAVADSLDAAGLTQSRVVFQLWSPNVLPSRALINGRVPDILLIGGLNLHAKNMDELIADAHKIPEAQRPLILCGGAKAIYEPWDFFALGKEGEINADVSVTGETFVLLELLERLLALRAPGETMRRAFHRARNTAALHDIPGLMYRADPPGERKPHLIDTGVQRLVQDLDELPMPLAAYGKIEPPHRRETLAEKPIPLNEIHRHCWVSSLIMTHGCKFRCSFCPIPAYNQNSFRHKSPQRIGDELELIRTQLGIRTFFGTDDNFLNSRSSFEPILDHLAARRVGGRKLSRLVRWGTEATIFDAHKNLDLMQLARSAGLRALWFGVEDLTGTVVKKGQAAEKTREVFEHMVKLHILPMPMMIHHDGQPLVSRKSLYGLLNQVDYLRKSGAMSMQISVLTPSPGSKFHEKPYEDGLVIESVGGRLVEEAQQDGTHIVATLNPRPWLRQLNVLAGYALFYNPLNFVRGFFRRDIRVAGYNAAMQAFGMAALLKTSLECLRWTWKLWRGPIKRFEAVPHFAPLPIVRVRPDEIDTKRPTAIPPDARDAYQIDRPARRVSLPLLVEVGS